MFDYPLPGLKFTPESFHVGYCKQISYKMGAFSQIAFLVYM